jgi:MFS family permease
VIVIVALMLLSYRGVPGASRGRSMLSNVIEGVRYVRSDPTVLRVILMMLTMGAFGVAIFNGLIAKWATDILDLRPGQYGLLASTWGVGSLIASYVLASTKLLDNKGRIFIISSVIFGLSLMLFGFTRSLPIAALAYVLNGMAMASAGISSIAIVQGIVPNEVRGRVMSLYGLNQSVAQLNGITLGAVAQVMGMAFLLPATAAVCTAIVAGLVLTSASLRRVDATLAAGPVPSAEPSLAGPTTEP